MLLLYQHESMTIIVTSQGWSKVSRKAAASEGWLQKAAEEADLIVDGEDDSDEEFYQVL